MGNRLERIRDYLALEQKLQVECGASPNFREGVFAFLERRPPKFQ
jgi:2-(1,2-epoxy-1,2-dihydrophenyl)acetyl-CoA isomerase